MLAGVAPSFSHLSWRGVLVTVVTVTVTTPNSATHDRPLLSPACSYPQRLPHHDRP